MSDRGMTAAALAAIADPSCGRAWLVEIAFDDASWYLTTFRRTLRWGGQVYESTADITAMPTIKEGLELSASGISLTLSGATQRNVALALRRRGLTGQVRLRLALLTADEGVVEDPVLLYQGTTDGWDIDRDRKAGRASVTLRVVNQWADWERKTGRWVSDELQQIHFPGDLGLEYATQGGTVTWPGGTNERGLSDAGKPIPILYGYQVRAPGLVVFRDVKNVAGIYFCYNVIVWAEGEIEAIDQLYINELKNGDTAYFNPLADYLGTDSQTADSTLTAAFPGVWTMAHRLRGLAYSVVNYTADTAPFGTSYPTFYADIRGKKCYDPRTQSIAFSESPALACLEYATNARYGRGLDLSGDMVADAFGDVADAGEVQIPIVPGEEDTMNTFLAWPRCDPDKTILENMKALLTCFGAYGGRNRRTRGSLVFTGGRFALRADGPATSAFSFDPSNMDGPIRISTGRGGDRANRVKAKFGNVYADDQQYHPTLAALSDFVFYDSATYRAADGGKILQHDIEVLFDPVGFHTLYHAEVDLKKSREPLTIEFRSPGLAALRVEVGKVVDVTSPDDGLEAKLFLVTSASIDPDVRLSFEAEEFNVPVFDRDVSVGTPGDPDTTLPDPLA